MHLKNWSLLSPEDGRTPMPSPVYDMLSTVPYIPKDGLALSLAGEKLPKALTPERWRNSRTVVVFRTVVMTAVSETAGRWDSPRT